MKIQVTFSEILEAGCWEEFCQERGYNPWMMNEGLAFGNEPVSLTLDEAKRYNVLPSTN